MNVQVDAWKEKQLYWQNEIKGTNLNSKTFSIKVDDINYSITPDASGNWKLDLLNHGAAKEIQFPYANDNYITMLDMSNFRSGNMTTMSSLFENCSNLHKMILGEFDAHSAKNLSMMFWAKAVCTEEIEKIKISDQATSMQGMFGNIMPVGSNNLNLSHWANSVKNVEDMSNMFLYPGFMYLNLSGWKLDRVKKMVNMFTSDELVTLDISYWNLNKTIDMTGIFEDCTSLKTIRMVGCNEATINKIKAQLSTDGITGVEIITK